MEKDTTGIQTNRDRDTKGKGMGTQVNRDINRQGHRQAGTETQTDRYRDTDGQGHRRTGTGTQTDRDRDTNGQGHR